MLSVEFQCELESIGSSSFTQCTSLEFIEIPETVISIESDCFSYCSSLVNISIPQKVTSIESSVFSNCINLNKKILFQESKVFKIYYFFLFIF